MLKGVVVLGKGHGAGIVPAVDDLGRSVHLLAALFASDGHLVDVGAVQFEVVRHIMPQFFQFLARADDVRVAALAHPHGQRRAPVALAGEAPVDDVFEEVAHAAFLDVVRHPVDGAVGGEQLLLDRRHADEPGGAGVVDQRRVASPAEGVIVGELLRLDQQSALFEVLEDERIGVFYKRARPGRLLGHAAAGVHQLEEGQVVFAADAGVVLAEGRGLMDDAGAVGHGDVAVGHHAPGGLVDQRLLEVKQRLVFHAHQIAAVEERDVLHRRVLAEHGVDERLRHDDGAALKVKAGVSLVGIDAEGDVAGQRPRRGRPGVEPGVFLALDLEAHEGGLLRHRLVALGDFVGGKRRAAARAVGHHLVALVEQALVGHLLE